jgi:hypothetical protein
VTKETAILCAVLLAVWSFTCLPCDRRSSMSTSWHQLLGKTWRDINRQIDITVRHHERQDYDTLYKEVSRLMNLWHTAERSLHDCQSINPLSSKALFIQFAINEGILCDQTHKIISILTKLNELRAWQWASEIYRQTDRPTVASVEASVDICG